MSKLNPSFSGMACIIWIAGWTWWLSGELNQRRETNDKLVSSFSIFHDGFKYASEDIFHFNFSESVPFIPEDNQLIFQSLANYLAENEAVTLTLTGVYALNEQNLSASQNLGLARAEALKTTLIEKGAPKEKILTKAMSANNFFQSNGKLMGGVYFLFTEQNTEHQQLETETGGNAAFQNVFFYEEGKYKLSKGKLPFLDSLRNHLRIERAKKVVITGFSEPEEEKNTSLKLAEMRAKAVRRYLVDTGVRRNQIEVKAKPGMAKESRERIVTLSLE